tara:strand:+ start:196584 stop:197306 length:723 start_codon:yes stop_codon:yes gene_type:complete
VNKLSCNIARFLLKAAICSLSLLVIAIPSHSGDGIVIGAPVDLKLRPKGSEVVLVGFKVIECFKDKEESLNVLDREVSLVKHPSCGEGYAHILMQRNESMISGEDKTFTDVIQIPYILNQPSIYAYKGHFKVKPTMNKHMVEKKGEVVISLSKIIKGHIKATVSSSFENVEMNDYMAHYEGDQTFVNQVPVKKNRIMTSSATLKLGEPKILSGDMWIEGIQKNNGILPEYSRLWIELIIK